MDVVLRGATVVVDVVVRGAAVVDVVVGAMVVVVVGATVVVVGAAVVVVKVVVDKIDSEVSIGVSRSAEYGVEVSYSS